MYDDAFDMRDDHHIDSIFSEDALPTQLKSQYLHEDDHVTEFRLGLFQDWLVEGKLNCDVAHAMLYTWIHDMHGSDSDTLRDFFDQLFEDYNDTVIGDTSPSNSCETPSTNSLNASTSSNSWMKCFLSKSLLQFCFRCRHCLLL